MCRKSIFVSFMYERLRMMTHWPRYIHREYVLRRAWGLHTILVVFWGMECDGLGKWHSRSEILAATDSGFEMTCQYHKT